MSANVHQVFAREGWYSLLGQALSSMVMCYKELLHPAYPHWLLMLLSLPEVMLTNCSPNATPSKVNAVACITFESLVHVATCLSPTTPIPYAMKVLVPQGKAYFQRELVHACGRTCRVTGPKRAALVSALMSLQQHKESLFQPDSLIRKGPTSFVFTHLECN